MHLAAISLRSVVPLGLATKELDQLPPPKVGPVGRIAREFASLRVQVGKLLGRDSMGHNFPETVSSSDEAPLHSLPIFGRRSHRVPRPEVSRLAVVGAVNRNV